MLQYVRRKERAGIDNRLHRPRAKRIIGGDETQWAIARRLHAASEEHAERLVRVPAFERAGDHMVRASVREGFAQLLVRPGRSGERVGGNGCVRTLRSWWWPGK